ncbi:Holliday junction resolvase RuvX [Okibacterium endophyticum]
MRSGVRIGIDVGKARIGVAQCDLHGMIATPVETIPRSADGRADLLRILELARERDAIEFVVGLPLSLSGGHTASTTDAVDWARSLAAAGGVPVRLVDERLSTVTAHAQLRGSGKSQKSTRRIIDQVAAVVILQHALDVERGSGTPPGNLVDQTEGP